MIKNVFILTLSIAFSTTLLAQMENYSFKQEIIEIESEWHSIQIPSNTIKNLKANYSDIRIYGITENDTIEAPYIFEEAQAKRELKNANFKVINQSHNSDGYFYTFVMDDVKSINQILLNFNRQNFDFKIKLEGSNVKNNWYTIIDNYQLIAVRNNFIDFSFTKVKFKQSEYKYFRLQLKTDTDPYFSSASISLEESRAAQQEEFEVSTLRQAENKNLKKTTVEFSLQDKMPVSEIQLNVSNATDYYRRYSLLYLTDSVETEKGYLKNYKQLKSGTIHSFEPTVIQFNTAVASHFKLEIENQDNLPLKVNSAKAKGNRFFLTARFNIPAQYFLTYGNTNAGFPNYDISYFTEKIPKELAAVELAPIQKINQKEEAKTEPLFVNSAWMYLLLSGIILLLAIFSINMLKNTKKLE
ncbi:MAG: DUF3999 family protein [Crocinitomicaceae bacterium]